MTISIVIPCLNEGNTLKHTVQSILNTISISKYEIIIVNSGGTNVSDLYGNQKIKIINTPSPLGPAPARNLGAELSSEEILVFIDGHMLFEEKWDNDIILSLKEHDGLINPCIKTNCGGYKGFGFRWKDIRMSWDWLINPPSSFIHEIPFAAGAFIAINRTTFNKIGKFDEGFITWGNEDAEISLSLIIWIQGIM